MFIFSRKLAEELASSISFLSSRWGIDRFSLNHFFMNWNNLYEFKSDVILSARVIGFIFWLTTWPSPDYLVKTQMFKIKSLSPIRERFGLCFPALDSEIIGFVRTSTAVVRFELSVFKTGNGKLSLRFECEAVTKPPDIFVECVVRM